MSGNLPSRCAQSAAQGGTAATLAAMKPTDRWAQDDVLEGFKEPQYPEIAVTHGMKLTHTGSRFTGTVDGFSEGDQVVLTNDLGSRQLFKAHDGAFVHEGVRVSLRAPAASQASRRFATSVFASLSISR